MSCFTCVPQGSVSIIQRFGKHHRIAYPGLGCLWCCLGEAVAGRVNMRVRQLDVSVETKTYDNVFIHIVVAIQYNVVKDNIYDAFYKLDNPTSQIRSYVFDVVRSSVPKMKLDDVFLSKEEIATDIKSELSKSMSSFGFEILQTLVTDIVPAKNVRDAMNEINAATRQREANIQKAEAQKVTVVKAAEAEAESKYLAGQGIARQRQAIVAGLRDSVREFSENVPEVNSQQILSLMMMTQYFDTLKDIGGHSRNGTVFLPHSPSAITDIATQIRDGVLQAQTMNRN